ncbi:MAG: alpha/beta fold hydrolase [Pseudomonadales bacterium]
MTQAPQLAFQVHDGHGPYLALVHGFLSSSAQWLLNLDALAEVCRPVTIELWGHGHSPAPAEPEHYAATSYVTALETIRRTLGSEPWFVCGYSLGAGLIIRYAHTYPSHTLGQIFTNSQSGFADAATLAEWRAEIPDTAAKIRSQGLPAIRRLAVHPRFAKRLPAEVYTALNQDALTLSPLGVAHTLEYTNLSVSTRDIAATNPRPALLCFGRHEQRFAPAKAWAQDNMRDLEVVELDAGHGVNMEDASGFNHEVSAFIRRHSESL